MKNDTLPLALSFTNCKIKEFKMFEGSCKGSLEIETSEFDVKKIWSNYLRIPYFEDSMLIFIDDYKLCIMPEKHIYEYRFEKGALKVYDIQQCEWLTFGYGNRNKLVVVKELTKIERLYQSTRLIVSNIGEDLTKTFRYAGISSINEVKDKRTKIYWCNIHYTFQ